MKRAEGFYCMIARNSRSTTLIWNCKIINIIDTLELRVSFSLIKIGVY